MSETDVYLIFANDPLEMGGSDRFVAAFDNEEVANNAVNTWDKESKIESIASRGARWHYFALTHYIQKASVFSSLDELKE